MKVELPLILKDNRDSFLVSDLKGELHTHKGVIDLSEIKGKSYGDVVKTHKGHAFKILPFTPSDFFRHFKRGATPIMPKDIGAIVAMCGLRPDSLILDAGTGSGMIAAYLAYFNKYGEVVTVEKRAEFAKIARENFRLAKLKNIHQIVGDVHEVAEGFKKEFDLIVLDMKDDYLFIPSAKKLLKVGSYIAVYNPYIEPSRRVYEVMKKEGFTDLECFEILKNDYEFKRVGTRPLTRVWHTGFIVIGRKC